MREQDLDTPAIEKRFAYTFLQQLIEYVDKAHQHMMDTGTFGGNTVDHTELLRTKRCSGLKQAANTVDSRVGKL